jgi:hypothetical protein
MGDFITVFAFLGWTPRAGQKSHFVFFAASSAPFVAFLSCDTNADFLGLDDASDGTTFAFFANGVPERAIWKDFSFFFARKSEAKS